MTSKAMAACALLSLAGAARAEREPGVPSKGEGTITLLGGPRWVPTGGFVDDQNTAGYRAFKTVFTPGFLLGLGYAADTDFHVHMDFGYGIDRIFMSPGK